MHTRIVLRCHIHEVCEFLRDCNYTTISYCGCLDPNVQKSLPDPRKTRILDQKLLSLPILKTTRNAGFLLSSLEGRGAVWKVLNFVLPCEQRI
jgi:hypothetical protein